MEPERIRKMEDARAIVLHDQVFGKHKRYSDPDFWKVNPGTTYILSLSGPTLPGGRKDLSFIRGLKRYDEEVKEEVFHIWLAGTLSQYEGRGFFSTLVRQVLDEYPELKWISLSTYPETFKKMFQWVSKRNPVILDLGLSEKEPEKGRKIKVYLPRNSL